VDAVVGNCARIRSSDVSLKSDNEIRSCYDIANYAGWLGVSGGWVGPTMTAVRLMPRRGLMSARRLAIRHVLECARGLWRTQCVYSTPPVTHR